MSEKEVIQIEVTTGNSLQNIQNLRAGLKGTQDALEQIEKYAHSGGGDLLAQFNALKKERTSLQNTLNGLSSGVKHYGKEVDFSSEKMKTFLTRMETMQAKLRALTQNIKANASEMAKAAEIADKPNLRIQLRSAEMTGRDAMKQHAESQKWRNAANALELRYITQQQRAMEKAWDQGYAEKARREASALAETVKWRNAANALEVRYLNKQQRDLERAWDAALAEKARRESAAAAETAKWRNAANNLEVRHIARQQQAMEKAWDLAYAEKARREASAAAETAKWRNAANSLEVRYINKQQSDLARAWDLAYAEKARREVAAQSQAQQLVRTQAAAMRENELREHKIFLDRQSRMRADSLFRRMNDLQKAQQAEKAAIALAAGGREQQVRGKYGNLATEMAQSRGLINLTSEVTRLAEAKAKLRAKSREAAGESHSFALAQDALHSAARGVTGVMGNLWLTYARMLPVLIATAAATAAVAKSFSQGTELDYQTRFAASLGDSVESVDELQRSLKEDLFEASKHAFGSAVELANGLRIMQQAGYDASDAMGSIGVVSQAALVGEVDMKTAAEDLVSVLEIFGLHSKDPVILANNFKHAGDVMAYVSNETSANLHDVASTFQNVIGVSEAYGVKIETVAALTEKLGKAGITAGRAGTFIRNFFDNALGPTTEKGRGILEKIGMDAFDFTKDDPVAYLDKLKSKVQEFDAVSQTVIENGIFTDRGIKVWRAYIDEAETLREATSRVGESATQSLESISNNVRQSVKVEMKEAFDALDDSMARAFENAEDGTSRLARELKEAFSDPALISAISNITEMLANMAAGALEFLNREDSITDLPMDVVRGTAKMLGLKFPEKQAKVQLDDSRRSAEGSIPTRDPWTGQMTSPAQMSTVKTPGLIDQALQAGAGRRVGTKHFESGKGGHGKGADAAAAAAERATFKSIEQAKRLADVEFQNSMVTVEHAKKVWEMKAQAQEVGQDEYFRVQEDLADLEVRLGVAREKRVQEELKTALAGSSLTEAGRERAESMLTESLEKEKLAAAKAESEKTLRQEKFAREEIEARKKLHETLLEMERDFQEQLADESERYYGFMSDSSRLDKVTSAWMSKYEKQLQEAARLGDTDTIKKLYGNLGAQQARATFTPDPLSGYTDDMALKDRVNYTPEVFAGTSESIKVSLMEFKGYYEAVESFRQADVRNAETANQMKLQIDQMYQQQLLDLHIQKAQERLDLGTGGWEDMMISSLGRVTEGFTTFTAGTTELMSNFFTSFTDGFANSVGRAVVYGEDLNQALANVAREGLAALISGLVKLGIQWMITSVMSQTMQKTQVEALKDEAGMIAAAYAPAATLVSSATAGSNNISAMKTLAGLGAMSFGIASMSGYAGAFDEGGRIPAGKWGIAGEYGPEIVQGPAQVTSRKETAELLRGNTSGRGGETQVNVAPPQLNVKNINVLDPAVVGDYLNTEEGERVIINVVQRNRQVLGV